jgi:hypothetical protein
MTRSWHELAPAVSIEKAINWGLPTVGTESWNSKTAQKSYDSPGKRLEKLFNRRGQRTKGTMIALSYALWKHEMIGAMDIDMLETKRSEPLYILWSDLLPIVPQFVQRILKIPGVPEGDHTSSEMARASVVGRLPRWRAWMSVEACTVPTFNDPATRRISSQLFAIRRVLILCRARPFRGP